ncbi:hypothetical protein [Ascidiaceihabitans sp.]|uniref:hypothetical protein n=1 Tax=Ascidiaceihabitans sp. TaxID=1872644 RepID=UPI003298E569
MKNICICAALAAILASCAIVPDRFKPKNRAEAAQTAQSQDTGNSTGINTGINTAGASDQQRPKSRPDGAAVDGTVAEAGATDVANPPAQASGALGTTVASLGSPAEPGLWLKTPLVKTQTSGTVSYNGTSAQVTLIPIEGPKTAGSRMSLQAFQTLGASLTDLVEVAVSI